MTPWLHYLTLSVLILLFCLTAESAPCSKIARAFTRRAILWNDQN